MNTFDPELIPAFSLLFLLELDEEIPMEINSIASQWLKIPIRVDRVQFNINMRVPVSSA